MPQPNPVRRWRKIPFEQIDPKVLFVFSNVEVKDGKATSLTDQDIKYTLEKNLNNNKPKDFEVKTSTQSGS